MKKYDVITAVAEAFDRAEKAETQLYEYVALGLTETVEKEPSRLDRIALEVGKSRIFNDSLGYWETVSVARDTETGNLAIENFKDWTEHSISSIPDEFSKKDFLEYFDWELRSKYEEEKEKAIERLNAQEKEEE